MQFSIKPDGFEAVIESAAARFDLVESVNDLNASWESLNSTLHEFVDMTEVAENIQCALDIVEKCGLTTEAYSVLNKNHELADLLGMTDAELLQKFSAPSYENNLLYRWYKTDVTNAFVKAWDALVDFIRRIFERIVGFFKTLFAKESACVIELDKRIRRARGDKKLFNPLAVHPTGHVSSKNALEVLSLANSITPDFVSVGENIIKYYTKTCGSLTELIRQSNGVADFAKKCLASMNKANASFNKLGYRIELNEDDLRFRIRKFGSTTVVEAPSSEDRFQLLWKTEDPSKTSKDVGWDVDIYVKFLLKSAEFVRYSSRSIFDFQTKANKLQKEIDSMLRSLTTGSTAMGEAQRDVVQNVRKLHVLLGSFLGIFGGSSSTLTSAFVGLSSRMDSTFFGRKVND